MRSLRSAYRDASMHEQARLGDCEMGRRRILSRAGSSLSGLHDQQTHTRPGKLDYSLIAQTSAFGRGLGRILQGTAKMRVVIMCAEKDPLQCHRCLLISPRLRERGIEVLHILSDGSLKSQER
jgi:hypothetical protein